MAPDVVWDDEASSSPDVVWDDQPAGDDAPGVVESYYRHAVQPATFGFADEAEGALRAAGDVLTGGDFDYTKRRDEARARLKEAEAAHPTASTLGTWGGTIGSALIPVPGGATKTLLGTVGRGALMGAAQGLGSSEADLTKGDVGRAAVDTGLGGLVGGAVGAAGHGLAKLAGPLLQRITGRAARGVGEANQQILTEEGEKAAAATATARAEAGNAAQAAYRHAELTLQDPDASESAVAMAKQLLQEQRQKASANIAQRAAEKGVAGQAYREAIESEADRAARGAAGRNLAGVIMPRVKRYALPAAGRVVGEAVLGPVGGFVGEMAGGNLRPMQHSLARMIKSPEMRRAAWQAVASSAGAMGKFGPALQRAATQGGVELAHALHESLLESDPDYQRQVQALLEQTQGGQ